MVASDGHGDEPNLAKARVVLEQACDQEEPVACYHIAGMYSSGWGVEADSTKALTFLERACEAGLAEACYTLATRKPHDG